MTDQDTKLQVRDNSEIVRKLIVNGDLSGMNESERVRYVLEMCKVHNLDPLTQPFDLIKLKDGSIKLYANKSCTDQKRMSMGASARITGKEVLDEVLIVWPETSTPDGRVTIQTGCVSWKGPAEERANAFMKAVTKAYRRGMLTHAGLSVLDHSEVSDLAGAEILGQVKALEGWKCSQETAQRIVLAAGLFVEKGGKQDELKAVFERHFSGIATTRDLSESQASELAEAYEAMAQEVK